MKNIYATTVYRTLREQRKRVMRTMREAGHHPRWLVLDSGRGDDRIVTGIAIRCLSCGQRVLITPDRDECSITECTVRE